MSRPLKFSAIGLFQRGRPSLKDIRAFFYSFNFIEGGDIGLYDQKYILIHFCVERDLTRVQLQGNYFVNKCPLWIWKWEIGFCPGQESSLTPLWLAFPGLPIEFWSSLKSLASIFGKSIHVDKSTYNYSRPLVARILANVDSNRDHSNEIFISVDGKGRFPHCCKLGHLIQTCFFKNPHLRENRYDKAKPTEPIHYGRENVGPNPTPSLDGTPKSHQDVSNRSTQPEHNLPKKLRTKLALI
ncbi:hypothetical protein AXF42_Ash001628 [Apostasia shenzhenica]|uniref:Uncharacterized protein n=1 Tax=Apostasia shenzhenica TaxID=1088818 RepID=A0A2I0AAR2_9ASPA|nr:hypothetical protein AXF42_Ash001628 [Apostasia shenzhenica]